MNEPNMINDGIRVDIIAGTGAGVMRARAFPGGVDLGVVQHVGAKWWSAKLPMGYPTGADLCHDLEEYYRANREALVQGRAASILPRLREGSCEPPVLQAGLPI